MKHWFLVRVSKSFNRKWLNFNFQVSQDSALTHLGCGGKCWHEFCWKKTIQRWKNVEKIGQHLSKLLTMCSVAVFWLAVYKISKLVWCSVLGVQSRTPCYAYVLRCRQQSALYFITFKQRSNNRQQSVGLHHAGDVAYRGYHDSIRGAIIPPRIESW